MAAIDYVGIRTQLKTILAADSRLGGVRIYLEEEPQIGLSDAQSAIAIFVDSRSAQDDRQMLAAGKRTRFNIKISIWTLYFSMESYLAACDGRDTLLAQLELVLMDNRTIGGKTESGWLDGGEIFSARDSQSSTFVAAAETTFTCEASAIST